MCHARAVVAAATYYCRLDADGKKGPSRAGAILCRRLSARRVRRAAGGCFAAATAACSPARWGLETLVLPLPGGVLGGVLKRWGAMCPHSLARISLHWLMHVCVKEALHERAQWGWPRALRVRRRLRPPV
jgi:hypothetical protein